MEVSRVNEMLRETVEVLSEGSEKQPKNYISSNETKTTWWVMRGGMPIAQKKSLGDVLKAYNSIVGKEDDPWYWDYKRSKYVRLSQSGLKR